LLILLGNDGKELETDDPTVTGALLLTPLVGPLLAEKVK